VQEGAGAPKKQYETEPDSLPWHTAVTLRAVHPWVGTGRTVIADAAFSSLKTCQELLRKNLWFIGVVKGCSKGFPTEFVRNYENTMPLRGSHEVITTTVRVDQRERPVMSVVYVADEDCVRSIIGTCSSSYPGKDREIFRTRRVQKEEDGIWFNKLATEYVKRPRLVEEGAKYFNAVDMNDRYRQGYFGWEMTWDTKRCWSRLFTTVLGIIITDSYLAYKVDQAGEVRDEDYIEEEAKYNFNSFLNMLTTQLIFNDYSDEVRVVDGLRSGNAAVPGILQPAPAMVALHDMAAVKEKYSTPDARTQSQLSSYQLVCRICHAKTSYCCNLCSHDEVGKYFACCSARTKRNCWETHLQTTHGN
jgi:hypothetical protein